MNLHDYSHVNWPQHKLHAATCVDMRVTINKMVVDTELKISTSIFGLYLCLYPLASRMRWIIMIRILEAELQTIAF